MSVYNGKSGSSVWLNCERLLAHHYQRKKKKLKVKRGKPKTSNPFFFMGNCTVGAKQLTRQIIINKGHDQKNSAYNEYEGK